VHLSFLPESPQPNSANAGTSHSDNLVTASGGVGLQSLFGAIRWMRLLQVAVDASMSVLAVLGAFLIRFDGHPGGFYTHQLLVLLPLFLGLHLLISWGLGVYRRLWRYTGLTEVTELGCSVLLVTTAILAARALGLLHLDGQHLSYGIISIECGLAFLLLVSPRVLRRLQTEHEQRRHWRQPVRRRALLVGAGDAGQMVVRELSQRSDLGVDIVGLLDDDPQKLRRKIGH